MQQNRTEEVADPVVSSSSDTPAAEEQAAPHPDFTREATPVTAPTTQDSAPIDLSTKKAPEPEPDSTSQGMKLSYTALVDETSVMAVTAE